MDSGIESTESSCGSLNDAAVNDNFNGLSLIIPDFNASCPLPSNQVFNKSEVRRKGDTGMEIPVKEDSYLHYRQMKYGGNGAGKRTEEDYLNYLQMKYGGYGAGKRNEVFLSTSTGTDSIQHPLSSSAISPESSFDDFSQPMSSLLPEHLRKKPDRLNNIDSALDSVTEMHDTNESNGAKPKDSQFTIPEGSRLELHFPLLHPMPARLIEHQINNDLETLPGLTFANVSPTACLNSGYDAYAQGYAVLPYESHDLQRKFKHYRHKLRQIVSMKPKERKLRIAASLNNIERVDRLLKEGVSAKSTDDKQRTPLHIAASKGYTQVVKLLLENGADPNQTDTIGNTPLHLAACTSHIETVTQLIKAGTDLKQADNQGYSPLHLAKSRLHILQRDSNAPSQDLKEQVYQIVEMMQTYLESAGNQEEAELLMALNSKLSLSDSRQEVERDLQTLLNSIQALSLNKSKQA